MNRVIKSEKKDICPIPYSEEIKFNKKDSIPSNPRYTGRILLVNKNFCDYLDIVRRS